MRYSKKARPINDYQKLSVLIKTQQSSLNGAPHIVHCVNWPLGLIWTKVLFPLNTELNIEAECLLWHEPGKSLHRGKATIPLVKSSTNCRISCWCIEKYFLLLANNQAHSWLTTAHAVPSPSTCIEISLHEFAI